MKLTLVKITDKNRLANGVTKANGYIHNGSVYEFLNDKGEVFTKYSFNIWGNVCKYRTSISDEIKELKKNYIKCGMTFEAEQLETINIPYEGDKYEFDFSLKDTKFGKQIKTIRKSN